MTAFDFIADRVRTFSGPSDSSVTLHVTEGATGSDDEAVICVEFVLSYGCFHIGSQAVPRHVADAMDRIQTITLAARETANGEATLLARAFETAAEWLREYAGPARLHADCFSETDGSPTHQAIAQELLKLPTENFRGNEYGFVRSVADRHYPLTEKQQQWFDTIVKRIIS